jgi:hypothetical protein
MLNFFKETIPRTVEEKKQEITKGRIKNSLEVCSQNRGEPRTTYATWYLDITNDDEEPVGPQLYLVSTGEQIVRLRVERQSTWTENGRLMVDSRD